MVDSDDPFDTPDATVIRPRPGAGKRGASDSTSARTITTVVPVARPPEVRVEGVAVGLNPLLQAASPLLRLAGQGRGASAIDVATLRQQALDEIRRFEGRARASGVAHEIVLAARYALCAALDEAVMSTPWGSQSEWAQHPLLVTLHREAWGGEKFFEMLERISADPARHLDLIELQYVCLALGFTGKYQLTERGHEQLTDVRRRLYRLIRQQRGAPPTELSLRWQGLQYRRNPLVRYVPRWVAAIAVVAVLAFAFTRYHSRLVADAVPANERLARIGLGDMAPGPAAPAAGPTLKMLLAPEEQRRQVAVEEQEGRTVVTLEGADLFDSGSADLNADYDATLTSIVRALNQVPGRVFVVGHTDDQALRSLRYGDNFELSRARAHSVVERLRRDIDNPGRITSRGDGSSSPRYTPPHLPENRARNRRVEITHVPGA